jgi:hypothetical protein
VKTEPGVDRSRLADAIRQSYGIDPEQIEFIPVDRVTAKLVRP